MNILLPLICISDFKVYSGRNSVEGQNPKNIFQGMFGKLGGSKGDDSGVGSDRENEKSSDRGKDQFSGFERIGGVGGGGYVLPAIGNKGSMDDR